LSPPPRRLTATLPHVLSFGSPGKAIVDVRHSSWPVCGSWPVMKQPSGLKRSQPLMPLTTTPSATMGPAVCVNPLR
jgi:hypothetical protein